MFAGDRPVSERIDRKVCSSQPSEPRVLRLKNILHAYDMTHTTHAVRRLIPSPLVLGLGYEPDMRKEKEGRDVLRAQRESSAGRMRHRRIRLSLPRSIHVQQRPVRISMFECGAAGRNWKPVQGSLLLRQCWNAGMHVSEIDERRNPLVVHPRLSLGHQSQDVHVQEILCSWSRQKGHRRSRT